MARNYKKISISFGVVFIIIVVAFVIYKSYTTEDTLVVGYMEIASHAPVFAAKDLGVFEKHNLKITLRSYSDTPSLMKAVEDGHVDVGFQLTADIVLKSASQGKTYYIYYLARSTEKSPLDGLYALDANINKAKLKGKKIGHFPGPTGAAMTKRLMKVIYDIDDNEYSLVPTAPPIQIQSLTSGSISLLFTYEPIGTSATELGIKRVISAPVEKFIIKGPWDGGIGVFTEELVLRRRSTAVAFLDALAETDSLIKTSKKGAGADAMAKLQAGLDVKTAMNVPLLEMVFATNAEEGRKLLTSLENQINLYRELEILPKEGRSNLRIFVRDEDEQ